MQIRRADWLRIEAELCYVTQVQMEKEVLVRSVL